MKKILFSILAVLISGVIMVAPVFADDDYDGPKCVLTSVLGGDKCDAEGHKDRGEFNCSCDDGNGSSIKHTLKLVIDIMSIGIGILAVLGITVSGVQYLTAAGSEEKTRKAKRRILEIVIGLVVYVLIYVILRFLIPGFNGIPS
jgi:cytochrome bd-type quinol oxidase subunit 2